MHKTVWTCASIALLGTVSLAAPARAIAFNDLFVFGDSYSDTGSFVQYSNGPTAVGYLAKNLGITLTTSQNPNPGTEGVNFAQTAAHITVGPTPPSTHPLSINQQVGQFASYVSANAVRFNPSTTLFYLEEGLNDASTPLSTVTAAITSQVGQLHSLGARYIELTSLPYNTGFGASAMKFDVPYVGLVQQLQQEYSDTSITLSGFGQFLDQIQGNPSQYGLTNATNACVNGNVICSTPQTYFFYYGGHPSNATSQIVGADLYQEALALPEPATVAVFGAGLGCVLLGRFRRTEKLLKA